MSEEQLAEVAQEVLRMTRPLCFSGPGEGRQLGFVTIAERRRDGRKNGHRQLGAGLGGEGRDG